MGSRHFNPSDSKLLNSYNLMIENREPKLCDVVVIGAGIHSLIYAIHTKRLEMLAGTEHPVQITILEKASSPDYKIGESTLTVFGLWLKMIGIDSPMLWRLFGPKDGLAFYYFSPTGDPEEYTQFVANGPPGDFVPTLQIERKVSELMLTIFAQRLGIEVLHGREALVDQSLEMNGGGVTLKVKNLVQNNQEYLYPRLLIDASGRHHRVVSKHTRIEQVEGVNTDAFWAYFDCVGDEREIPLRNYESVNTNHLCVPEGWAWVIRLPSWEGSPIQNLINMINHLLDLNAAKTPADDFPSVNALVKKFRLKFRWVVSIGLALRSDIVYPDDLSKYGNVEAEQKFNWMVAKYPKINALMKCHSLIQDLYGPGTTWFIRKRLAFRSPEVTGQHWMAIGDATGFTNPLYSPGINANMATSIYAAELTDKYVRESNPTNQQHLRSLYAAFCKDRIPNLQRMNLFNYQCMRSPALGPLGPLWQYLIGTGHAKFQGAKNYSLATCGIFLKTWDWGANQEEYIAFTSEFCKKLQGLPDPLRSQDIIDDVLNFSSRKMKEVIATAKYKGRWSGLLRFYDDDLMFDKDKIARDILARRCVKCGEWKMLRSDMRSCVFCGWEHTLEESTKILYKD